MEGPHNGLGSPTTAQSSAQPSYPPATSNLRRPWHPKFTLYRMMIFLSTITFGLAKAIETYRNEVVVPITLEWCFGVIISLLIYALGECENSPSRKTAWFFEKDYARYMWSLLELCDINTPSYSTAEIDDIPLIKTHHPPLTGYRLLVSIATLTFGIVKSICVYLGQSPAANTLDWLFGVAISLSLYWLGLYVRCPHRPLPKLFEVDYSDYPLIRILCGLAIHPTRILLCIGWTGIWFKGLHAIWVEENPKKNSDVDKDSIMYTVFPLVFKITWSLGAIIAVGLGTSFVLKFTKSTANAVRDCMPYMEFEGPLLSRPRYSFSSILRANRSPILGRIGKACKKFLLIGGYLLVHVFGSTLCIGWSTTWALALVQLYQHMTTMSESLAKTVFTWLFAGVWTCGAAGSIIMGLIGFFKVLSSLVKMLRSFDDEHSWKIPIDDFL